MVRYIDWNLEFFAYNFPISCKKYSFSTELFLYLCGKISYPYMHESITGPSSVNLFVYLYINITLSWLLLW